VYTTLHINNLQGVKSLLESFTDTKCTCKNNSENNLSLSHSVQGSHERMVGLKAATEENIVREK
jgi:hypothetical protein